MHGRCIAHPCSKTGEGTRDVAQILHTCMRRQNFRMNLFIQKSHLTDY
jgi:hypothetical protein